MSILVDQVAAFSPEGSVAALTQVAHRMSGLGGTIGFPTISARAAELEALIGGGDRAFDASLARNAIDAIRLAFTRDLASPSAWASPAISTAQGAKILVAEDDSDQRAIVATCLEGAGYVPIAAVSGDLVVNMARAEKPALILLDIDMPGLDGFSACRLLKADPELAGIPVIFMTARASLEDKLAGLTLGAEEFWSKPVDMRELLLRIQLVLTRSHSRHSLMADEPCVSRTLTYPRSVAAATEAIGRLPARAMIRTIAAAVVLSLTLAGLPAAHAVDDAPAMTVAPYAHMKWVKLGELVPMQASAEDAYVRLIAIEGAVLLSDDNE